MNSRTPVLHARLEQLCAMLRASVEGRLDGVSVTFVPALPCAALAYGDRILASAALLGGDPELLRRVLAHELVHVDQHRTGRVRRERRVEGVACTINPVLEAEAEAGAGYVARGGRLRLAPPATSAPPPVLQPLVTIAGTPLPQLSPPPPSAQPPPPIFTPAFQKVLSLIQDGPAWLEWAMRPTSPPFAVASESDLIAQVQFGLHGSMIAVFPNSGLRLAPSLLLELPDPDFGNIVGSLQSGGLTTAALAALGKHGIRTEADFTQLDAAFAALGLDGAPATHPSSLAGQVQLYRAFGPNGSLTPPATGIDPLAEVRLPAAQFAASVAQDASELASAYSFYLAVAAQVEAPPASNPAASSAATPLPGGGDDAAVPPPPSPAPVSALVPTLWTAVGGLTFDYLKCPELAPGTDDATVLRGLETYLRQAPLLGFATIAEAIANCGGQSGIALSSLALDPSAASQVAGYMLRANRLLRLLISPAAPGTPAAAWEIQRCQDGVTKWYAITAPTGRARLQLDAAGCLTLQEFVPIGNTTA